MDLDTGKFKVLTARLDELDGDLRRVEARVGVLEMELWARIDALEARSRAIEAQVSRQTALFMDLQRELLGWRNEHAAEVKAISRAQDQATAKILAAIRATSKGGEYGP